MIVLFTDFGSRDPYVGQVKARLAQTAPDEVVVDLLHDVPEFNPHAGAHLLAAFAPEFPAGSVFLAVVDPGVGTPRQALVVETGDRWFVGPDNGLLSVVAGRNAGARFWRIDWRPERLSATFHARDLFSPVASEIARGAFPADKLVAVPRPEVEFDVGDLPRVVYVDHYGNAWTGIRDVTRNARISAGRELFAHAETFGASERGQAFWYTNSVGLVEIAVNRGSAATRYGLKIGDPVQVHLPN